MPQFDLVVQNGTIVTASDVYHTDVGIIGGKIAALGRCLVADQVLDASNKYVFPGFVDFHVHMQLQVGDAVAGIVSADDFRTGSIAAACGGTTTIVDFVTPERGQSLTQAVEQRRANADGRVAIDYALHLTAVDATPCTLAALPELAAQGYSTLKMYTTYDTLKVNDADMLALLQACRDNGILALVHAENHDSIAYLQRKLVSENKTGPEWHPFSRPPLVEAEAVHRVLTLAHLVGAPLYLVHLSCAESLAAVRAARERGQSVFAEVCAQHLLLSDQVYRLPAFQAANFVLAPPLRDASHQDVLWRALSGGELNVVSTDHCPWTRAQRERGKTKFTDIPNGIPGVETRVPLIFYKGVIAGRLTLARFVDVCATTPARLAGLYPRKGTITVGSDADLVIFDPARPWMLSAKTLHHNTDHCPYEGWQGQGYPETVLLGGRTIVLDTEFVGNPGMGHFLARYGTDTSGCG
ncbi:MAG: dihydropyrimidinase [Anaerolineae bacterium]|nr:dihydropyrimidinase [Anaerolineae bacterium]